MKIIYSDEDLLKLSALQEKLTEYDVKLIGRLQEKLNRDQVLHDTSYIKYISDEVRLKTDFVNDNGRQEIIGELKDFYTLSMPIGIEIE